MCGLDDTKGRGNTKCFSNETHASIIGAFLRFKIITVRCLSARSPLLCVSDVKRRSSNRCLQSRILQESARQAQTMPHNPKQIWAVYKGVEKPHNPEFENLPLDSSHVQVNPIYLNVICIFNNALEYLENTLCSMKLVLFQRYMQKMCFFLQEQVCLFRTEYIVNIYFNVRINTWIYSNARITWEQLSWPPYVALNDTHI